MSYLHHDIVTGSCLLSLVHPALYHIITGLQQVLEGDEATTTHEIRMEEALGISAYIKKQSAFPMSLLAAATYRRTRDQHAETWP